METGTILMIYLIIITFSIINLVAQWKLFKKAGRNGWEILIPIYSSWVLLKIAGLNWSYFLIIIISGLFSAMGNFTLILITIIVTYYITFITYYNIAKKTKQSPILYGILAIFIPYIPILILGFSKNITYDDSIKVSEHGPFGK